NLAFEMASIYCDAIIRQQPQGPYQLAGISFGGVVAVEAAKILRQRGEQVSLVVLLDSILPSGVKRSFGKQLKYIFRQSWEAISAYLSRYRSKSASYNVKAIEKYR